MPGAYLAGLVVSLVGMVLIDRRWKLLLWRDARRGILVLAIGVVFLLVWDVVGVGAGVFFRGPSTLLLGIQLAPEVPLEEPFFLALLCYLTMNLYGALDRRRARPTRQDAA
ncbi:MAG: lycopene cyclase domain-containing protein [Micrococcales bacterium]|nr:lycopene cyclase domain-containing protein [Micrococcales bacterium]